MRGLIALVIVGLVAFIGASTIGDASHGGEVVPRCGDYRPTFNGEPVHRSMGDGRVDVEDFTSFLAPVRRLGTLPGNPNYHPAWDRIITPVLPGIQINDMTNIYAPEPGFLNFPCSGRVRYMHNMRTDFDFVTGQPTLHPFVNSHYSGGIVYPSASGGNSCCEKSWFDGEQWVYLIWERMERLTGHNEHGGGFPLNPTDHGLKNMAGDECFYGSSGDHIVDFGDDAVQSMFVSYYTDAFNDWSHYTGIYADDFNIGLKEFRCGGVDCNNGNSGCPRDPDNPTPTLLTVEQWTGRAADLVEVLHTALPNRKIMVNTQPTGGFTYDSPNHQRILAVVDYVEIEHGLNDTLLNWTYADLIHQRGANVVFQGYIPNNVVLTQENKEFALASYLIINAGDFYMTFKDSFPANWDSLYETDLGHPLGPRYNVSGGIWRRDFQYGYAEVNISTGSGTIVSN